MKLLANGSWLPALLVVAACDGSDASATSGAQAGSQAGSRPAAQSRPASAPDGVETKVRTLTVTVPKEWKSIPTTSAMRAYHWSIPGVAGAGDAELVVFWFGSAAGSIEANLERWKGQMVQEPKDNAKVSTVTRAAGGKPITVLEIAGTYVAEKTIGSGDRYNEKGWRMAAAVVETSAGPYYFKLVGPRATVERWSAPMLESLAGAREK